MSQNPSNGSESGRLLLCLPLYTSVPTVFFTRFLMLDRSRVADTFVIRKVYLSAAMTRLFESCLAFGSDWDRAVVMEADMLPPLDALNRIANYPDHIDVCGSIYFQHPPPHRPVVYSEVDPDHFVNLAPNQIDEMMAKPGLYPVDGVGFGLTSIHRRVLEKWDPDIPYFGNMNQVGHDWAFCHRARQQGFTVHIDTGIHCGHLSEVATTYEDHKTARETETSSLERG